MSYIDLVANGKVNIQCIDIFEDEAKLLIDASPLFKISDVMDVSLEEEDKIDLILYLHVMYDTNCICIEGYDLNADDDFWEYEDSPLYEFTLTEIDDPKTYNKIVDLIRYYWEAEAVRHDIYAPSDDDEAKITKVLNNLKLKEEV